MTSLDLLASAGAGRCNAAGHAARGWHEHLRSWWFVPAMRAVAVISMMI